jgi:hypothetical protein
MRLIAFETSRTTLLFPLEEISPLAPIDGREVVESIVNRYNFKGFPPPNIPREEINKIGAKFENGLFSPEGHLTNIFDFTAFSDGIVVTSNTTESGSAFIDDVLTFLRERFAFRQFVSKVQRTFLSQVVVEFDRPLSGLFAAHGKIADLIANQNRQIYGVPAVMDFGRLDLELDKTASPLRLGVPRFIIERRPGVPFSQERYFCSAPMHTKSHLELLEEIERMAAGR